MPRARLLCVPENNVQIPQPSQIPSSARSSAISCCTAISAAASTPPRTRPPDSPAGGRPKGTRPRNLRLVADGAAATAADAGAGKGGTAGTSVVPAGIEAPAMRIGAIPWPRGRGCAAAPKPGSPMPSSASLSAACSRACPLILC